MLRNEKYYDYIKIKPNSDIFKFKQYSGRIVIRNFSMNDDSVCIFENLGYDRQVIFKEIIQILRIDSVWSSCINTIVNVNFKLHNNKLEEVINYHKRDYRTGYMLILNGNFDKKYIKPFWKMINLYLRNITFDSKIIELSDKEETFKKLYYKYIYNSEKHEIKHEDQPASKRVKTQDLSYGPPQPTYEPVDFNPIQEAGPADPAPRSHVTSPPAPTMMNSIQGAGPTYPMISPTLQGSMPQISLQEIYNFVKDNTQVIDPRLRRDSLNTSHGSNSSVMSQLSQLAPVAAGFVNDNSQVSDPRLRRDSLNTSQGSNSSVMSQLSQIPPAAASSDSEEVTKLKKELLELQKLKNKIYIDATNFKKECEKHARKISLLQGELSGLKTLYRQTIIKKEEYLAENTKLKTLINKGV
jgi:hypothetical protein